MAGAKLVAPWGRSSYIDTIIDIESSASKDCETMVTRQTSVYSQPHNIGNEGLLM